MSLSNRQFKGKLSYAIYKNMNKIEPIVSKYFKDVEALAKAFEIEEKDGKYNFEGEAMSDFEAIINAETEIELHKIDVSIIEDCDFSVVEIGMLEFMTNVEK
jgi:meiotically up-regulated gene 157 (Mug157) protein